MGALTAMIPTNYEDASVGFNEWQLEVRKAYRFTDRPYGTNIDLRNVLETKNATE
jgi:hypothetical protein